MLQKTWEDHELKYHGRSCMYFKVYQVVSCSRNAMVQASQLLNTINIIAAQEPMASASFSEFWIMLYTLWL
jgi:hypothetical protein